MEYFDLWVDPSDEEICVTETTKGRPIYLEDAKKVYSIPKIYSIPKKVKERYQEKGIDLTQS